MSEPENSRQDVSRSAAALGSRGGRARAAKLTAEERRAIASKAGKASAEARKAKKTKEDGANP